MAGINKALSKANKILDRIHGKLDNRAIEVLMDEELERHLKQGKKTVLYVGIKYDYGNRDWGLSYEHYNFYHTLLNMEYSLKYTYLNRLKDIFEKMEGNL